MAIATAALAAGQAEFTFECGPLGAADLSVLAFEADEELSRPYAVDVTLAVSAEVEVDAQALLGESACLTLQLGGGEARFFHGIAFSVRAWEVGAGKDRQRLRITVVPKLSVLGKNRRSRIFQGLSTVDIAEKVLGQGGVKLRKALSSTYAAREYCVQYAESDLDFVSRLLEEEGIFYFFEHEQAAHTMVLADAPAAWAELHGGASVPFREPSKMLSTEEFVDAFSERHEVRPTVMTLRDFDYLRPALDLTAKAAASGDPLEVYDYPGRYVDTAEGKSLAKLRLESERCRAVTASGGGVVRRLVPGAAFELREHPVDGINRKYAVVSVRHRGHQPEAVEHGGSQAGLEPYRNEFSCLPSDLPFRPELLTPRGLVPGPQTALVVGPAGEEIFTDAHGRIKVQFHWDREGKKDDHSSCWVRVSQAWAGPGWGALYLPRIGHEVVVEFLEGDPDRPLVTGSVYNGANPPPVDLPAEKTRSTLRSASSPGSNGSNELRFEDAAGHEEVYFHAQKDLDIVVENDKTQRVGGNEKLTVQKDRSRTIHGNQTLAVTKNDSSTVGMNQSLRVDGNRSTSVGGNHSETVAGSQTVTVGVAQAVTVAAAAAETIGAAKALTVGAAYAVSVGGALNEAVGGIKAEEVGGAKTEVVGGNRTEKIGGSRSMTIGKDLSDNVTGKRSLKVGKDLSVEVGAKLAQTVKDSYTLKAKTITISAEDELTIKVGSAEAVFKKNGDVVVKGNKVSVKASGEIVLKGSKVSSN